VPGPALELKDIILRAGAGAGKTTTLTHLFLDYAAEFLMQHKRFPRMVVTTFTRKATQELKERLLLLALERQREDLFQYITNKSQVQISTIHGVLSLFLGRYGHKIGLSSDFQLQSGGAESLMRRKILRRLILSNPESESLLESYSFRQLEEALQAYYEHSFLYPEFRFVPKEDFARDLQDHLQSLEELRREVSQAIFAETSQASWVKYAEGLQRFSLKGSLEEVPGILTAIRNFISENPRKPSLSSKNPAVSTETAEQLGELVSALKELLESPEYLPEYWEAHEKVNGIFAKLAREFTQELLQTKVTTGTISMADLEFFSLKLIQESPESCESFAAEWDYWMIDEYQDTSPVQVALLKALVGDRKSFVVGDPQQSIYLFRGARSEVFQEKVQQIRDSGGEVREKLVNYRSTPRLLHFINHYFLSSSDQFAAMEPSPQKTPGPLEAPVAELRLIEKAEALSGLSEETLAALERIQKLLAEGRDAAKICVLSRTRNALESLAKAAEAYGIPVQIHVAGGFYQRREVRDALCFLKFLVNPHDNLNFLSCLRSPWLHLGDQEILSYCHTQTHSFWTQALKEVLDTDPRHPVLVLKNYLQMAQGFGYSFVLRRMLVELGLFDFAQKLDPTGRREANLWKLVSALFREERTPGFNFLDFVSGFNEAPEVESGGDDSDATPVIAPKRVNLMTIHASKGLQFDHVVVLGMTSKPKLSQAELFSVEEESGLWSLSLMNEEERKVQASRLALRVRERFNQRELQEHLRVLYVALTRAKETLTLVWAGKAEKNSWAASCPLTLLPGLHQEGEFSYTVVSGPFAPQVQLRESLQLRQDPGPWTQELPLAVGSLKNVAVTRLIAEEMESAAKSPSLSANALQKALAKAYRGTEAHLIFESLKYTPVAKVLETVSDEDLRAAVEYIAEVQEFPLLGLIQQGFVEWGFRFQHQGRWIQGQIDLWGVLGEQVWIVDYKTGSSEDSLLAFRQLQAYAWALHRMNFLPPASSVHLAVVYPFEKKIKIEKDVDPTAFASSWPETAPH